MNLAQKHTVYFLGIGGIGMSAIARYFKSKGIWVGGYDLTPSPITDALQEEEIPVHFEDTEEQIPREVKNSPSEKVLIVLTPAIPEENKEYNYLLSHNYEMIKRASVIGEISKDKFTIAVAGAHGKTSTCAVIVHLLKQAGIPFYGFLGGIATNYNTNYFEPPRGQNASVTVVEADEYDRSFLQLEPDVAVITSIDADHLDVYGNWEDLLNAYHQFANNIKQDGMLVSRHGLNISKPEQAKAHVQFDLNNGVDLFAENIRLQDRTYSFDLHAWDQSIASIKIGTPGDHNILNALAAIAATFDTIRNWKKVGNALHSFKGVKRRFEYILDTPEVVFIDDYAHHPRELDWTVQTLQNLYPAEKITGIFQPHLYSRTKDFYKEFAQALDQLDCVILLDIYPAREKPMKGVSSQLILEEMQNTENQLVSKEGLVEQIEANDHQVIATLGAGDIDRLVAPIKEKLMESRMSA